MIRAAAVGYYDAMKRRAIIIILRMFRFALYA